MYMLIRPGANQNIFHRTLFLIVALSFTTLLCGIAQAQSTRAEEIANQQAEKAKHLEPFVPSKAEKILIKLQNFLQAPQNFYPMIPSTYPSGGFALGAGYRRRYGDTGWFDVHGGYSILNYKMLDGTIHLPELGDGTFLTDINAHYVDATQVRYFGIGNDTPESAETSYGFKPISVGVTESVSPTWWLGLGGGIDYVTYETRSGDRSTKPSIEEVFDPVFGAPGLFTDFTYYRPRGYIEIDYRTTHNLPARERPRFGTTYATSGGFYRADYTRYIEKDLDTFDFDRVDVELDQFIPLARANWVIALRALVSTTDINDNDQIPFFLLPSLGGGSELRGYPNFRFTDRNRMLLTAEYRWTPSKFMDMAIFYEVGKVAAKRGDLDFNDLHDSYGIGVRFHAPRITALRFDVAHSDEATFRLIISGGASF
jgi:hypothetical protein